MKTSNKLLLAIALTMLIIPILVVAITVKTSYVSKGDFKNEVQSEKTFAKTSSGYYSKQLSEFNSIIFPDANDLSLTVKIIEDDQSGIKIPEKLKDNVSAEVLNGILTIKFSGADMESVFSSSIIIYSSKANTLNIKKGGMVNVSTTKDSLILIASDVKDMDFHSPDKMKSLSIEANDVPTLNLGGASFETISMKLNHATAITQDANINRLEVNAGKSSQIQLNGGSVPPVQFKVTYFTATLSEESSITINNVEILKADGKISDDSNLNMQAKYLRMFLTK